jgi:hypothetical protein
MAHFNAMSGYESAKTSKDSYYPYGDTDRSNSRNS